MRSTGALCAGFVRMQAPLAKSRLLLRLPNLNLKNCVFKKTQKESATVYRA